MRNIGLIIKGNLLRLLKDKVTLMMILIVLPIIVSLGIYFGGVQEMKGKIVLVNPSVTQENMIKEIFKESEEIKVQSLNENIKNTSLITGAYLAEISFEGNDIRINEYSNKDIKEIIESVINKTEYKGTEEKSMVVTKIVGFLMMFLFYGALATGSLFLQDRDSGVYLRVLSADISFLEYTLGQIFYMMIVLIIPTSIISVGMIEIFNISIEVSILEFLSVIALLGTLCVSMMILISNIFKKMNEVQMNGAIIGMITSLFSGCLIAVDGSNKIIEGIRNLFPQKRLLDFTIDFNIGDLSFVVCSIIIFIFIGVYLGNINYKKGIN
ncbi:MAG: ABC transporter permease [Clostridium sp.]|uniref:ABC transporter permease n=1 Tax=Clostridium sp. TaxID=1506 RepID=UPI003F3C96E5